MLGVGTSWRVLPTKRSLSEVPDGVAAMLMDHCLSFQRGGV